MKGLDKDRMRNGKHLLGKISSVYYNVLCLAFVTCIFAYKFYLFLTHIYFCPISAVLCLKWMFHLPQPVLDVVFLLFVNLPHIIRSTLSLDSFNSNFSRQEVHIAQVLQLSWEYGLVLMFSDEPHIGQSIEYMCLSTN